MNYFDILFAKKLSGSGGDIDLQDITITENGEVTAPSGVAYKKIITNVPLPENAYLKKSVSGLPQPIASFSDGADAPLNSLTASIVPVQDLHGYDSPWPAGGGKNKFDGSFPDITSEIQLRAYALPNGTYTVSSDCPLNTESKANIFVRHTTGSVTTADDGVWNGQSRTIVVDAGYIYIYYRNTGNINPNNYKTQIESGSQATSWTPYENECPISGWSGANIVNMSDITNITYFNGLLDGTYSFVDLGTISWFKSGTSIFYGYLPTHKVVEGDTPINAISSNGMIVSQMPGSGNDAYIIINDSAYESYTAAQFKTAMSGVYLIYELATPTTPTITAQQFNTLLEAFNIDGLMVSIPFTDGQGQSVEVFGGSVDVVNGGEQPRTMAKVDLGSLNWSVINANKGIFGATVDGLKTYNYGVIPDMLCSIYKTAPSSYNDPYISANGIIWSYVGVSAIRIKDTAYSDATAFKEAVTGQQLVYELATPTTFYTQPTSIKSLDGENNVSASTGEVTECEYFGKESS